MYGGSSEVHTALKLSYSELLPSWLDDAMMVLISEFSVLDPV